MPRLRTILSARFLFRAFAFLFPVLSIISGLLAAPLFGLIVCAAFIAAIRGGDLRKNLLWHPLSLWVLAFAALSGASYFWAVNPQAMEHCWQRIMGILAAGMFLLLLTGRKNTSLSNISIHWPFMYGMAAAFAISLLVSGLGAPAIESIGRSFSPGFSFELYKMNRGAVLLAILLWPLLAALMLRQDYKLTAAFTALTFLSLHSLDSGTAVAAFLCGIICFAVVLVLGAKRGFHALEIVLMLFFLCLPLSISFFMDIPWLKENLPFLPESLLHRFYIWQFAMEKIQEHPLLGWGLGSSDFIPGGHEAIYDGLVYLPLHPHNNFIQIWLELGAGGVILYLALIFYTLRKIHARCQNLPLPVTAAAYAMVVSYLAVSAAGYGLWQSWWIAGGFLSAMVMVAVISRPIAASKSAAPAPQTA